LVHDYVAVYRQVQSQPHRLAKLEEELARVSGLGTGGKKGGMTA
jgi:hypothetical protein